MLSIALLTAVAASSTARSAAAYGMEPQLPARAVWSSPIPPPTGGECGPGTTRLCAPANPMMSPALREALLAMGAPASARRYWSLAPSANEAATRVRIRLLPSFGAAGIGARAVGTF